MRVGIVTDLHLTPEPGRRGHWNREIRYDRALTRLRAALDRLGDRRVEALLMLGDLTEEGDVASLRRAYAALAEAPAPVYVLGGNHDGPLLGVLAGEAPDGIAVLDRLESGGVRVVAVHAVLEADGAFTARLDLPADDGLVVAVTHFPLVSRREIVEGQGLNYAGDLRDTERTAAALRARPGPTVVLCGHLHVDDVLADGGLLQLVIPPLVEGDGTAAVVEIEASPAPVVRRRLLTLDGDGLSEASWRHENGAWR